MCPNVRTAVNITRESLLDNTSINLKCATEKYTLIRLILIYDNIKTVSCFTDAILIKRPSVSGTGFNE